MEKQNILITGASGFLGSYILSIALELYNIFTLGRRDVSAAEKHLFWNSSKIPSLEDKCYKKVVHVAGKAHFVPNTKEEHQAFFDVNVTGTHNLLLGLEKLAIKPQQIIYISSVSVYGLDVGENISEIHETSPYSSYGKSKLLAEQRIIDWCNRNNCNYLVLRLPLIVGKNPLGNLGAMKHAIRKSKYPRIKENYAQKSIVLAEDVARLILKENLPSGIYNLTDGIHPTFFEIEKSLEIRTQKKIKLNLPYYLVKVFAKGGDFVQFLLKVNPPITSSKLNKIMSSLTFDDTKARTELGWNPQPVIPFIKKYL